MSEYTIAEVDLRDPLFAAQVTELVNASFGTAIDKGRIYRNTATTSGRSVYLAAKIGDEIIGFNAFISHSLQLNSEGLDAYQSCWTATSSAHRGKKIFQNLINAGRDLLTSRDAAFLFGFPNSNSRPLFVEKLGFREIGSLRWKAPLIPFFWKTWLNSGAILNMEGSILQDDEELIALKTQEHGNALVRVNHNGTTLWGIKRKAQRLALPVFELGGINLNAREDIFPTFGKLCGQLRGRVAMQLTSVEGSRLNPLFRPLAPVLPPLIIDDLNLDTRSLSFSFLGGLRDYY